MKSLPCLLALLGLAASASAQLPSEVFGVDLRGDETFSSRTADFVTSYVELDAETRPIYGLDFNAGGDTLYGVDNVTLEILTIDTVSGVSTPTGVTVTGTNNVGLHGLTAAADGTTWYLCEYHLGQSKLYVGDIVTGVFTFVGICQASGIMIDLSINAQGELYGLSISDYSLHSINTNTGANTRIGNVGILANFAQGMDFDPATGELYAAVYVGGGVGHFCTLDLVSGVATVLESTLPLDAEMEIAIRPLSIGTQYCQANVNSTGVAATITGGGSDVATDNNLTLTARYLPNNAFGFFIVSPSRGFVANPGGSAGNLCLSGAVGRYVGPGQILNTGTTGGFSLSVNLAMIPTPTGPVAAVMGDTYNFQTWFRDASPSGPTSNFTNGLEVLFR